MVKYVSRVEVTPTGWCVEWSWPINEGQFNRRKRRRYKKSIKVMSQAELFGLLEALAGLHAKRVAATQDTIFSALIGAVR